MTWVERDFLVVVKTYPNPSRAWQECVCVAAIDTDGKLCRLFPIPFRTLGESQRFKKWQWIRGKVVKARRDARAESYQIDWQSITPKAEIPAGHRWSERWRYVKHLLKPSLEAVQESGATLGLIKPSEYDMLFSYPTDPHWTTEQRAKLRGSLGATDLFGAAPRGRLLERMPVEFRYQFRCNRDEERPHKYLFEDWEVCESWRKWAREKRYHGRPMLEAAVRNRYVDLPRQHDNLYLFVGTHARWGSWLVIGHVQPMHLARKLEVKDARRNQLGDLFG